MDKQKFLLKLLATVFGVQMALLGFEMYRCFSSNHPMQECPQVENTFEKTFNVIIATTLALLTGSAISKKDV